LPLRRSPHKILSQVVAGDDGGRSVSKYGRERRIIGFGYVRILNFREATKLELKKVGFILTTIYHFIRFPVLGATMILPFLGIFTIVSSISLTRFLGFLGIGLSFHVFAYVTNDVVDLPLDKSEPGRTGSPLVNGYIKTASALIFAIAQIPLSMYFTMLLSGTVWAYLSLMSSYVLMSIYNLWGKKMQVPIVTDVIQGVGWSFLVLYGFTFGNKSIDLVVIFVCLYIVLCIMMTNGVHASLRDIENDYRHGAKTTAIYLGTIPQEGKPLSLSTALKVYSIILQCGLFVISILSVSLLWNQYISPLFTLMLMILMNTLSVIVFILAAKLRSFLLGLIHMFLFLLNKILLFSGAVEIGALSGILAVYLIPYMLTETAIEKLWLPLGKKLFSLRLKKNSPTS
jgi:4-hydroxybenzoate polyprenyltransferase